MMLCTWVGGEPMVRKQLIEAGRSYFKHNTIVTNGTMELPDWPNCTWVISIDGTEEAFARMRAPGIYQKIKQNVISHPELNIQISCVLTSITRDCVEDLLKEWGPIARGGIIFDFFTPVTGLDEALWLDWPTRDRLIDRILSLKKVSRVHQHARLYARADAIDQRQKSHGQLRVSVKGFCSWSNRRARRVNA